MARRADTKVVRIQHVEAEGASLFSDAIVDYAAAGLGAVAVERFGGGVAIFTAGRAELGSARQVYNVWRNNEAVQQGVEADEAR